MIRIRNGRSSLSDVEDRVLIEDVRNGRIVNQMVMDPLPNRRPGVTLTVSWPPDSNSHYYLTIGYNPKTGLPAEAFICGAKAGSEMDALMDDACIAISKLLQAGADPAELSNTFGGQSIIGVVASMIAVETELANKEQEVVSTTLR